MNNESYYRAKFNSTLCALDVIDAFDLGFNLGNVVKYVLRAGRKDNIGIADDFDANALCDLEKARNYLTHQIELLERRIKEKSEQS